MLLTFCIGSVCISQHQRRLFLQETVLSQGCNRTPVRLSGENIVLMKVNVNVVRGSLGMLPREILKI